MSNKNKFQEKANALFEKHPDENKIIIVENGQCFFDETIAKDYHELKGFEKDPETFFREGFEDEDDSDLQEALQNAELKKLELQSVIDEIIIVADLEQEYEPAGVDTNETVTSVISLREKYASKENELIEANAKLEELDTLKTENDQLKAQLETLNKEINNAKTNKDASKTDSKKA